MFLRQRCRAGSRRLSDVHANRKLCECYVGCAARTLAVTPPTESVRIIRDESGLAKRRIGPLQPVMMLTEQLVDRTQISQHLGVMFTIGAELKFVDTNPMLGMKQPLLQLLEDLQGQL